MPPCQLFCRFKISWREKVDNFVMFTNRRNVSSSSNIYPSMIQFCHYLIIVVQPAVASKKKKCFEEPHSLHSSLESPGMGPMIGVNEVAGSQRQSPLTVRMFFIDLIRSIICQ